jgi:hypothetical protein
MRTHRPEETQTIELVFQPTTGIDILCTRGTPVELIGDYLTVGNTKMAGMTFRTAVLEYFYEKLTACPRNEVRFAHSTTIKDPTHARSVESGVIAEPILDHITATVMAVLEHVTTRLLYSIDDERGPLRADAMLHIDILVDLFEFELEYDGKAVAAHVNAPIALRWIGDN